VSDPYERIKTSGLELPPRSRPAGSYAPGEINGASYLLREIFGDPGVHTRTAIGAQSPPGGAPVEVELIASLRT
jgi:hypothetical protein